MINKGETGKVRIDKWLWAARFFKTRSMATQAVAGGKVHVNGERQKPSRTIGEGDMLRITRGDIEFIVVVLAVSDRRGPATQARLLYEETAESIRNREIIREQRRLEGPEIFAPRKRPGKRDRRLIRNFIRKDE